jgi:hypothetical protein
MFKVCHIDQITCWRKLGTRRKPPMAVSHWQTDHILSSTPHHGRVLNSHTLVVEGKDCLFEGPPHRCNG